jgi:crotonobetainyl-CoA:carnitine CoA-transferase CaiB-like acyl-CoA transferase
MKSPTMNNGPLRGVRVTEFTSAWAGPYATCLLGFLGAEVIKVESLKRLDHSRFTSFTTAKTFSGPDESPVFDNLNLNKLSVCLNLSQPKAVEIAKRLVATSDIVVENMRPGVIARLGLDYAVLRDVKPDIIYLSSSACGQTGPDRRNVGYAPNFAGAAGLSYVTGYPDWPPSVLAGSIDLRSATTAAFAILAALLYRQRTGEGQYIDLSSQEAVTILNAEALLDFFMNQRVRTRAANRHDRMAPHNCYRCRGEDNWISIAVADDEEWRALCGVMGRPELAQDERFSGAAARWKNQDDLDQIVGEWTMNQGDYEVMHRLQAAGIAAMPSLSNKALFQDRHLRERGVFVQVSHPVLGNDWVIAPPWRLSETPAGIGSRSPLLGEHSRAVLEELLGMSPEEIRRLEEEQVVY